MNIDVTGSGHYTGYDTGNGEELWISPNLKGYGKKRVHPYGLEPKKDIQGMKF